MEAGLKFGRWTTTGAVDVRGVGRYTRMYDGVVCECGSERMVRRTSLASGGSTSCGCGRVAATLAGSSEHAWRRYYGDVKVSAVARGLPFALSYDEVVAISSRPCDLCGALPSLAQRSHRKRGVVVLRNGIDRVDNSEGYVASNCITACRQCNKAKGVLEMDDFAAWVRDAYRELWGADACV